MRTCDVADCDRQHKAKGFCRWHYQRLLRHGSPHVTVREYESGRPDTCTIADCGKPHLSRGWCSAHWTRWQRHGNPLGGEPDRILGDDEARFWSYVDKSGDCWEWTGGHHDHGYGAFYLNGHKINAHRAAYQFTVGPIPDGLELDHLCVNPPCVNPDHLEPVTHAENLRRAREGAQTGYRRRD